MAAMSQVDSVALLICAVGRVNIFQRSGIEIIRRDIPNFPKEEAVDHGGLTGVKQNAVAVGTGYRQQAHVLIVEGVGIADIFLDIPENLAGLVHLSITIDRAGEGRVDIQLTARIAVDRKDTVLGQF